MSPRGILPTLSRGSWLQVGPEMSVVERVDEVDIGDDLEFNDFTVG